MPSPDRGRRGDARSEAATTLVLGLPAIAAVAVFFLAPLTLLIAISFSGAEPLGAYAKFAASPAAKKILVNTLLVAVAVTAVCLVIAVPFCLALRRLPPRWSRLALLAVTLPLWVSVLVRSYAWLYVLAQEGIVNAAMMALGLVDTPAPLLFNWGAVTLGMVHILLPYAVLPVHNAVQSLDPQLLQASRSLGAGSLRTMALVVLPLIGRGVAVGGVIVLVLAVGFYVTPQMLGGRTNTMMATYVDIQLNATLNWPGAAASSLVLVAVVLAGLAAFAAIDGRHAGSAR